MPSEAVRTTSSAPSASERRGPSPSRSGVTRDRVEIGMGECAQARAPQVITCQGVGSCVTVALYDWRRRIGGLCHVMLPHAHQVEGETRAMCADQAIPTLVEGLLSRGAKREDMVARIAGGAQMFAPREGDAPGIGEQNVRSVKDSLKSERIALVSEDTGGNRGRTVQFHLDSGKVLVTMTERRAGNTRSPRE